MFHHFPKNLDRTITFNSVILKNAQKYYFCQPNIYLESADKIIFFFKLKFYFFPTLRKITVGGFVNQLIKKFRPY